MAKVTIKLTSKEYELLLMAAIENKTHVSGAAKQAVLDSIKSIKIPTKKHINKYAHFSRVEHNATTEQCPTADNTEPGGSQEREAVAPRVA